MLDCLILGDSIAVGTHQARPECVAHARSGWTSRQWNRDYSKNDLTANTVIISLGSNDHASINSRRELETLRAKVKGSRVFWILPAIKEPVRDTVKDIARQYGDVVLPITRISKDGVHPTWAGYKALAENTK